MLCPRCSSPVETGLTACKSCGWRLDEAPTAAIDYASGGVEGWTRPASLDQPAIAPGAVVAGRYEILECLGTGGMGAVFKARDADLDRIIALKVIRPDLASQPEFLRRFKQELILARQVTHRNVVRIYDLGIDGDLRFITMAFVDGRDLASILEERARLPAAEAAAIVRQIASGLSAAHHERVVHRDLKPRNIMVDAQGTVWIMDFGVARSIGTPGATETGGIAGTPAYMSPEQACESATDARSDIFSLGLIFYEMLTGELPFKAESAVASLVKRSQEGAVPPSALDPSIPAAANGIVMKCLARDPGQRYQSAEELIRDLDGWLAPKRPAAGNWRRAAAAAALAGGTLLGFGIWWFRPAPPMQARNMAVLVADFQNRTSDPLFDSVLEPAFTISMEAASFINILPSAQARKILSQVRPGAERLDEAAARLVAIREGVDVVVSGAVERSGSAYQMSVRAIDPRDGREIVARTGRAASKQEVLALASKLAAPVRKALGDKTAERADAAAAETFTTSSLEAAQSYARAQDLQSLGKWKDAIPHYMRAVELDPKMGRAYAGLAVMYTNLHDRDNAEKYFQLAVQNLARMTEREKLRTRGVYYVGVRNDQKAIEEYGELVRQFPGDRAGYGNLALAYFYARRMKEAQEFGRKAVEISPRHFAQRNNLALYALYAGNFADAERQAKHLIGMAPEFEQGYGTLAAAQLGNGHPADALQTYRKMEGLSPRGASLAAVGIADLALVEGRIEDAAKVLERAASIDIGANDAASAARKITMLAEAHLEQSKNAAALKAIERALILSHDEIIGVAAARVLVALRQPARAAAMADQLAGRLEPEPQAYAHLIRAEIEMRAGRNESALRSLREAQQLADTWLGRYDRGLALLALRRFAEADAEFQTCIARRGEATAVFLDDVPTYRYLPPVYYYQGCARKSLHRADAANSFRSFRDRRRAGRDTLTADARRQLF